MVPKSHRSSSAAGRGSDSFSDSFSDSSSASLPCFRTQRSCLSISSVRYVVFLAFLTKGCFRSSLADGLSRGSLLKHSCTKSLKALLKLPSSAGGGFLGIKNKTFMGCISA